MMEKTPESSAVALLLITAGEAIGFVEAHIAFFGLICTAFLGIAGIFYNKRRITESRLSREQLAISQKEQARANDIAEKRLLFDIQQAKGEDMATPQPGDYTKPGQNQGPDTKRVKVPPTDPK